VIAVAIGTVARRDLGLHVGHDGNRRRSGRVRFMALFHGCSCGDHDHDGVPQAFDRNDRNPYRQ
jgi:hypothetical protein